MPTIVEAALSHLGEPGPLNTCLSNGVQKWAGEAGLPQLGNNTASVPTYRRAAIAAGYYHQGLDGVMPGDVLDWGALSAKATPLQHVSVCVEVDSSGGVKSVGSGTMTSIPPVVSYQPKGGTSFNSPGQFRGYIRLPGANQGGGITVTPAAYNPLDPFGSFAGFGKGLAVLQDRNTWIRLGLGAIGGTFVLIALITLFARSSAGQAAASSIKSTVKTAAKAAVVIPK